MKELRNHKHPVGLILILVGLMTFVTPVLEPKVFAQSPVTTPSWTYTGNLNTRRSGHTATLLRTGKVLVAGGIGAGFLSSAELYDPATGTWSNTGSLNMPRSFCTATPLPDGRVLVVGGFTNNNPPDFGITNTAELYDPSNETWSLTGNLADDRAWHTATYFEAARSWLRGAPAPRTLSSPTWRSFGIQ